MLNNEPHNEGTAHCESSLFNNEGIMCVSSPTQTARKAWITAALAKELQRVLAECGNEAVLAVGDLK